MRYSLFFSFIFMTLTCSLFAQEEADTTILDTLEWEYDWVSYQSKVNLDFNNQTQTVNAFFVNRKDSIIYVNINKMGFELVRIVLTPEQVRYANSIKNEFYEGDYDFLSEKLGVPLDFEIVQSLLTGTEPLELADFPVFIKYTPEPSVVEKRFFSLMNVEFPFENMKLQMEVKNLKWNVPGPTSLKIPDKYKSIE